MSEPRHKFLRTAEAATYLALSRRTLEKLRVTGGGPPYRKLLRCVTYRVDDLDAWADTCQRRSTSDPGADHAPTAR
jgi:hypothetical protein